MGSFCIFDCMDVGGCREDGGRLLTVGYNGGAGVNGLSLLLSAEKGL